MLGVNVDPDAAEAHAGNFRNGLTWRSWWDGEGKIMSRYGVKRIPVFLLIDAEGIVRHKIEYHDVARLEGMIERLLDEAKGL